MQQRVYFIYLFLTLSLQAFEVAELYFHIQLPIIDVIQLVKNAKLVSFETLNLTRIKYFFQGIC